MSELAQALVSDFSPEKLHRAVEKWYESSDRLLVHNDEDPFEIPPEIYGDFSMLTAEFVAANGFNIPIKCFTEMTIFALFMFSIGRILQGDLDD